MTRPAISPERLRHEADHHETVLNHPEDIRALVLAILNRGQAITDSYDDWLRVGFALASELGEDGRQYFHQLSEMSSKYDAQACDQKYNQCLKQNNGSVSIKTLYFLAQHAGINLQELALAKRHEAPRSATKRQSAKCQQK